MSIITPMAREQRGLHAPGWGEDMVAKFKTGLKLEGFKVLKVSLIVGGVISGALLLWQLSSVLLLFFAAIVAAVILRSGAKGIEDPRQSKPLRRW
ncbi:hypothetical protein ABID21_003823 [Pseudorhizobium tarimense]|uniref:Uncharacterized protein n=2 Tax=Pseudorhizobium tarimense TaxID=1079109 RepID=A0ABV2HAW7_9HYPH|nr:hypothetical protein [Pseudorhizobium tarimense]MCJ8520773.1 hypothetical protein [Pseudorhizobium tarimense]